MNLGKRDRGRSALFGAAEHEELEKYDPERLERQNDAEIEGISERAKHLKEVTVSIQNEVEGHLRLLDQMGLDMDHTRGAVSGTMERFKRVLEHKGNKSLLYAGGAVFTLFAVFKLIL